MIEVDVAGGAIRGLSRAALRDFVVDALRALQRARVAPKNIGEVSIRFVDDEEMTRLNKRFRGKKKTTDVLTFPADVEGWPDDEARPLGDIVISLPQAARQSVSERHSLATEVRYLVLHGIIHALGFDHETDDGEMHALEQKIRPRVGLE